MRVSIDQDLCCATGNCVFSAPEVFDQDADGVAFTLVDTAPSELEAKVQEAADLCPVGAILLLEN